MKINKTMIVAAVLVTITITSVAQSSIKGGDCILVNTRGQYNCTHLGLITIKGIYDKGWRVVATYLQDTVPVLIIEEQKP